MGLEPTTAWTTSRFVPGSATARVGRFIGRLGAASPYVQLADQPIQRYRGDRSTLTPREQPLPDCVKLNERVQRTPAPTHPGLSGKAVQ
jgi:hypothetical protein